MIMPWRTPRSRLQRFVPSIHYSTKRQVAPRLQQYFPTSSTLSDPGVLGVSRLEILPLDSQTHC